MTTVPTLSAALARQRVLPVLREPDAAAASAKVAALVAAGARVIELTTTIPDWPSVLKACADQALIGVGTITTPTQATTAIAYGAAFLVSPYPSTSVRPAAGEIPFIEGGFTPAEIAAAAARGPAKVFPAHVGGPTFIRSLRAVLPDAMLIPTGGITLADVDAYLAAGAIAVGVGSGLPTDPAELVQVFA